MSIKSLAITTGITMTLALGTVAGANAVNSGPASASVDHGYVGKHEPSAWSRVIHRCHKIGCTSHLNHAIRTDLGIGNKPVRVHYGDTTWIWVKYPHGIVHTFTS